MRGRTEDGGYSREEENPWPMTVTQFVLIVVVIPRRARLPHAPDSTSSSIWGSGNDTERIK